MTMMRLMMTSVLAVGGRRLLSSVGQPIICSMNGLSKRISPDRMLFANGINMALHRGAKVGVVGPNGVGKSSWMKILAGTDKQFDGTVSRAQDLSVVYLEQEPELDPKLTVIENIRARLKSSYDLLEAFETICGRFSEPDADVDALLEEQSKLQTVIEDKDLWNLDRRISVAMAALQCPPADYRVDRLSGGEKRRVALCALLLVDADMILLDEPTNHLDAASVAWLERFLSAYKGAVVAITHDRYFLDSVANYIVEVDTATANVFVGNYSKYLEQSAQRALVKKKTLSAKESQISDELEWIRGGGRHTASKARMKAFQKLSDEARLERQISSSLHRGKMIIPFGRRLGNRVIDVTDLRMSFDGRTLFDKLSFKVEPGHIVGVVGPNGCGKSTLIRVLIGELEPEGGVVDRGQTVEVGYVLQSRQQLNPKETVFREIVPDLAPVRVGRTTMQARHYVAQFNFTGPDQEKLIEHLSGGERNRVHLAKLLRDGCNLLVLDEPTNDLDIGTLRSLEEGLNDFPGSAIIVSHDRWFLDRTCTHILAFEADGSVRMFTGNYTEYLAWCGSKGYTAAVAAPS
ncbi:ABC transporter domain-containing protein [Plasmodiophora brassicae]|uniref:ABC transporter domain-containing protein n=1 Tax=Plasmodiophora brassicae TaxID=37360 RepID=A0A3P3Y836_PLABS|nr:unnamed protein product [Plasmodiophora brassicae]